MKKIISILSILSLPFFGATVAFGAADASALCNKSGDKETKKEETSTLTELGSGCGSGCSGKKKDKEKEDASA